MPAFDGGHLAAGPISIPSEHLVVTRKDHTERRRVTGGTGFQICVDQDFASDAAS